MTSLTRTKAFAVRLVLALHFVLVLWRVTVSWGDSYWLGGLVILPFLLEAVYTLVRRKGLEWKLFSLCFFFYLGATLPGIWLLEIKKTLTYQSQNYTQVEDVVVSGVEIPIRLSPDTWVLVVEEMMLYLMILGRWMLPRGDVGREQLTQLLFGFIGIASDIMELFSLFDEDTGIRHNTLLTYIILGVWSLSVLQFTLTFTTAHRPRRARGLRLSTRSANAMDVRQRRSVLRVELLATVLSLLMQDGPFLAVRLYTIVKYDVITYSLVFFTSKNVLVILLLVYKAFLLLIKLFCPRGNDDDDDDDDENMKMEKIDEELGMYYARYADRQNGYGGKNPVQTKQMNGRPAAYAMHPGDVRKRKPAAESYVKPPPIAMVVAFADAVTEDMAKPAVPARQNTNGPAPPQQDLDGLPTSLQQDGPALTLQEVIDGPATPAKPMDKGKKHLQFAPKEEIVDRPKEEGTKDADVDVSLNAVSSKDEDGRGDESGQLDASEGVGEQQQQPESDTHRQPHVPGSSLDDDASAVSGLDLDASPRPKSVYDTKM